MNKNIWIGIIVVVLLGILAWVFMGDKPDTSLPEAQVSDTANVSELEEENTQNEMGTTNEDVMSVVNEKVSITWKGFGPGRLHEGSFPNGVVSNLIINPDGMTVGTVEIDMSTLKSDDTTLETHLKSADFFDVAKFPKAMFVVKESTADSMTGTFTIHGVTKNITFPIVKSDVGYTANFRLNLENFGIKQAFANSEIELMLTVPLSS